jgi:cytochrome c556
MVDFCSHVGETTRDKEPWMRPLFCAASVLALVALACLTAGSAGAQDDEENPSIKTVMEKLHKGAKSPVNNLKTALKASSPDWEAVQKETKLIKKYGDALPKNDPPRGKKEAFEKLAKAYADSAKSLNEAAERENLKGARDALKKIQNSCAACHKAHRKS